MSTIRNKAARTIQRVVKKRQNRYRYNTIALEPITNSWYVKWFKDKKHKHFSVYSLNTFNKLMTRPKPTHPETRLEFNPNNVKLVKNPRNPPKPGTSRPNITMSPVSSANNKKGWGNGQNGFNHFTNNVILNEIFKNHRSRLKSDDELEIILTTWGVPTHNRVRRNILIRMIRQRPV